MRKHLEPMTFVCFNLSLALMERIRAEARYRSVTEGRNVTYSELVRVALAREFPATEPKVEGQLANAVQAATAN